MVQASEIFHVSKLVFAYKQNDNKDKMDDFMYLELCVIQHLMSFLQTWIGEVQ